MQPFSDLNVSTSTYMIHYNDETNLNLEYLFEKLPTTSTVNTVKKITWVEKQGTILNIKYKKEQRGIKFEKETYFPNQITLTMSLENKNINFFLFKNKIEIRGIKQYSDIKNTISLLNMNLSAINHPIPRMTRLESIMINLNYRIPFKIDRLKLCKYLINLGYHAYYDPQFDNGVVIKIKNSDNNGNQTVIIFQSGMVLHSGRNTTDMEKVYNSVYNAIMSNKNDLEIKFRVD